MPTICCKNCGIEICYPRGESAPRPCPACRNRKAPAAPVIAAPVVADNAKPFEEGESADAEAQPKQRRKRFSDPEMQEDVK